MSWKVEAAGEEAALAYAGIAGGARPREKRARNVWFGDAFVECEVLDRYALEVGTTVEGPAVIEERVSTCVLGPGDRATADACLNLVAELASQLLEFMDEYALDDLAPLSAAIRGQSERAIRDRIAALPDGIYEGTLDIEGIDDALRLACRAEVDGGGISLDFAGTSPPVDRGINVPLCYTRAMACYAVKCLTVPGMPNNEGAVAPIRVSAPQDSILNAQPPYPTGGRHVTRHMVVPLVFRTLADAVPGQVQADCGVMNLVTFQGTNPGGRPMSTIYFSTGGFGALQNLDGAETTPGPSNMRTVPTEMWESLTDITIVHKRLLPDSSGHGEARGGLGQEIEFRNDTGAPLTVFCVAPRSEFPARGLFGGGDGSRRTILIDGRAVHPKGAHTVAPGQRFTMRDAGGGGFGAPSNRPRAKVLADVAEGFVTPAVAREVYGVDVASGNRA